MSAAAPEKRTSPAQKALLLLFGLLLVFAAEGILRLSGIGGPKTLFVRSRDRSGREIYVTNKALNRRLFFPVTGTDSNFPRPQMPYARFPVEKEKGTFRFFVAGASSSVAMPYAPNIAFASFLKEMIAAGGSSHVEGINASMTAVSSYQVGRWVSEILDRYDPDLVVVYTGHNEFYGVLGAGSAMSVGSNRTITKLFQRVQETAFYSLVAGVIEKIRRPPADSPKAQPLESLTKDREIRADSGMHRGVEASFRANLEEMARAAEKAAVPIVFCTPVSNRSGCAPMGPMHREGFPEEEKTLWNRLVQTGDARARLGQWAEAEKVYREALALDSTHAGLLFRLGKVYEASRRKEEARRFFDRALLHDGVRLRASERIVEIVRRVARDHEAGGLVFLADTMRRFADESPGGIVGSNLILEHIHMNGRGHYLAASEIYDTLLDSGLFPELGEAGRLSFAEASRRVGYTGIDRAYAASFMRVMLRRWPYAGTYRNEARVRAMESRLAEARASLGPIEREVFDSHPIGSTALHLYHRLGVAYLEAGEYEKAAERFRLLTEMLPMLPEVQILLARALSGMGQREEARAALDEAHRLDPRSTGGAANDPLLAPLLR